MKKIGYGLLGMLFLGVLALNRVNAYRENDGQTPATHTTTEKSTVSAPVSAEQKTEKTYRVSFKVNPVVNASLNPANQ